MKAIVKTKQEPGVELVDLEMPKIGDTEILIKVRAASLCGTDIHIYEWSSGYEWLSLPLILGHEFSGEVVEVGSSVNTVVTGDRVTVYPYVSCGGCRFCQAGKMTLCTKRSILGLTVDGAFAEYIRLPTGVNVFKLPDNVSYETAAMCEPLSVALHAVENSGLKPGQTAAVLGPGPIGLLILQMLRIAGASLCMMAGTSADRQRLEIARDLGADLIVDVEKDDVVNKARELTGGNGVDVVFEATGDPRSIHHAAEMAGVEGKIILVGIYDGAGTFNPTGVVRGKKSIVGSYAYETETWRRTLALLSSGRMSVEKIITHRLSLSDMRQGFDLALKKEAAKVIFVP